MNSQMVTARPRPGRRVRGVRRRARHRSASGGQSVPIRPSSRGIGRGHQFLHVTDGTGQLARQRVVQPAGEHLGQGAIVPQGRSALALKRSNTAGPSSRRSRPMMRTLLSAARGRSDWVGCRPGPTEPPRCTAAEVGYPARGSLPCLHRLYETICPIACIRDDFVWSKGACVDALHACNAWFYVSKEHAMSSGQCDKERSC